MSEQRLQRAFTDVLGVAPDVDWQTLAYRRVEEWDSVAHMQLVGEIEQVFDIMLDTEDVIGMSSYPVAKEIVARYGVVL